MEDLRMCGRATFLVALLLLSYGWAAFAAPIANDDTGLGPPPALAPGQAPPLPKLGPLAEPRSQHQVGFPAALTASVIPPGGLLTPAAVALGENCSSTADCLVTAPLPAPRATIRRAPLPTAGLCQSASMAAPGQRNAPTVLNALYNMTQFWDGRVHTLEQQAALPIANPFEMGSATIADAVSRIAGDKDYQAQFMQAFGRDINDQDMLRAIATYERTLVSFDSPFDHFIAGEAGSISESAKRGWELFNTKAHCNRRHALTEQQRDTTVFTDNDFHNIRIGILRHNVVPLARQAERDLAQGQLENIAAAITSELSVLGRFLITKKPSDIASFKTPDLRNILVIGPYFHDGSMQTLWDVMDHYNKGDGVSDPWLDEDIRPLALTESEIDDVVAFLASLTSPQYKQLGHQEYARQLALAKVSRPQRDTARAFAPKPKQPRPPPF